MPANLKKNPSKKKVKKVRKQTRELSLPTELSTPKQNLHEYTMLIYGERKIGKTSLTAQFEDPLHFMFEPGGNALRIRQVRVNNWVEFLEYLTLLERNPGYCKTVVIDTGSVAYDKCLEYVCEREGMIHPSDGEYGKGWKLVSDEFKRAHEKIFAMGLSFIVTAHSEIKGVMKKDGSKYHKLTVDLGGSCFKYYCGVVDVIAYYQYDGDDTRLLTIRGDAHVEAGVRMKENFLYKNGNPINNIPMGNSEEEAYDNFIKAFNNEVTQKEETEEKKTFKKKKKVRK